MMSLHALCCGLPALALVAVALSGTASGAALFADSVGKIHHIFHAHEVWILAASAFLVISGGLLELHSRRHHAARSFPWLFALSVGCFALNVAIIAAHRGVG